MYYWKIKRKPTAAPACTHLFSAYLDDTLTASELIADDTTMYSRWCNGARPIPIDILKTYEDEDEWDTMEDDFRDKIIPNLLNEAQARIQMEELITDSIKPSGRKWLMH